MVLPPYSPELNPVERLWQYMKKCTIRNKVYDAIEKLEETICNLIVNFKEEEILNICSLNY